MFFGCSISNFDYLGEDKTFYFHRKEARATSALLQEPRQDLWEKNFRIYSAFFGRDLGVVHKKTPTK